MTNKMSIFTHICGVFKQKMLISRQGCTNLYTFTKSSLNLGEIIEGSTNLYSLAERAVQICTPLLKLYQKRGLRKRSQKKNEYKFVLL